MWIKRELFEQLISERTEAQTTAIVLARTNAAQQASLDWLQVRVTQLEKERAQMIFNYTGVKVEVPEVVKEAPRKPTGNPLFDAAVSFNDVGDAEAQKQGLGWNDDGTLKS